MSGPRSALAGPWLHKVPADWGSTQIRRVARFRNGADYKPVEVASGGYPVYGSGGEFRRSSEYLHDGTSVLFGRKGTVDRPLLVHGRFWTVDTMFFTEIGPQVEPRYFHYYATTMPFDYYRTSTALPSMTQEDLSSHVMPLPPLDTQRAIADYLDRETTQIDTLIAKQEQLITRLRERRQAAIVRCASQGIDSNAIKRSSLGWTNSIPEHWEELNLRRVATMKTGHTPSRTNEEYWENTTIPWFTLADVWQLRDGSRMHLGETKNQISELGLANSAAELLPAGTVVLSRTASVGFSGIMPIPMATSQDFWNWVCSDRLMPEFLVYIFRAMKDHFRSLMIGSTHQTIYQPVAAAFRIPLPPLDEQRRIVAYLDEQTAKIDTLIAKAQRFIELAKERREALITAAVTGQLDVTAA